MLRDALLPPVGVARIRERIVGIDRAVPVLDGSTRPYINFDNAATTPALRDVLQTVDAFMQWAASVHRGAGFKSKLATRAYEDARELVGEFVGADPHDHVVIFGKNTTEAINKLSFRLGLAPDDVVLVSVLDHHSNDLPWRARARVDRIGADAQGRLDEDHFDRLLARHAGRVRLVAITGASNVTGFTPPIHRLAAKAHAAGARILVDCAQLAPHRPVRMRGLEDPEHLDYVTLSAHKLYAPLGTGALIGRRDTFEQGEPEYRGGGTIRFVDRTSVAWASTPERDEAGTPNVAGAIALAAATLALRRIGMEAIARHEAALTSHLLERMARLPGLRVLGDADPCGAAKRLGVIAFNLDAVAHARVAAILGAEHGIGVRNGCFCAHPYLSHLLGLDESELGRIRDRIVCGDLGAVPGAVRVSFGIYNTIDEVDTLASALESILDRRFHPGYALDPATGEYSVQGWSPDLNAYFGLRSFVAGAARPGLDAAA